jgi:hypothetical protein
MPVYVDGAGCTNACRHCAADGRPPHGAIYSADELRELAGIWEPVVLNHEPSAHPEFPEVMDPNVVLCEGVLATNGFGLARAPGHGAIFRRLRQFGYTGVSFTLHGLEKNHDWFVRRKGAYQDILCASARTVEAGLGIHWNIFLDRRNLTDVPTLVELCREAFGGSLHMGFPYHRVSRRMWWYEKLRPSLGDVRKRLPAELITEISKQPLEHLTEGSWLHAWRRAPDSNAFRHPCQPAAWPPSEPVESLALCVTRDRTVELDPLCAPRIKLGELREGQDVLVQRLRTLPGEHPASGAPAMDAPFPPSDLLHDKGYSVRYKAISATVYGGGTEVSPGS